MSQRVLLPWATIVVLLSSALCAQVRRQPPRASQRRAAAAPSKSPCVDIVTFRQGMPAKGLIVDWSSIALAKPDAETILMAVPRDVFRRDNSAMFDRSAPAEREEATKAWSQLKQRLERELEVEPREPALTSLFERELERASRALEELAKQGDEPLTDRFMWLELKVKECALIQRAPPQSQRVAVWAWGEELVDVTSRDQKDLLRELSASGIDPALSPPDLSKLLPPRSQSDDQWAARLALVRYTFGRGLDFQGSGDVYLRSGNGDQPVRLAPLIEKMMSGSIETLLKKLDPGAFAASDPAAAAKWFEVVVPRVEEEKRTEFRITRLEQDPTAQAATVETALVARLPSRGWQIVWSTKQSVRTSEVTAQAEQQIAADPQVKSALSLLSALGANAEQEVKKAIRFGAATMAAQKTVESQFFQFRDRYGQRLDGPPLSN